MSFKIKLLTPITPQNGLASFLQTTMSEFYSLEESATAAEISLDNKHSFCFTFDESLSLRQNGQKELSFSMLRKVWQGDQEIINPFVHNLSVGTQILLIDQFEHECAFTVTNIQFTFKNQNIVYKYTCQDSFTYQMIRQNEGYVLENDSASEDFIGAKDIDWWVLNKIQPECYISYQYIPLFQGLLETTSNNLVLYNSQEELEARADIKRIIKPIFSRENYQEYYEPFVFSVSGGNASSSLISLGEMIGLGLNFTESFIKNTDGVPSNQMKRFFWFEPLKDENPSGLRYSPHDSISSFGLTYNGSALTTVLNVAPSENDEEVISLIPEVPLFFRELFQSSEWEKSSYSDGYFTSVCQGVTYISESSLQNEIFWDASLQDSSLAYIKDGFFYLKIWNTNTEDRSFKLPSFYNLISFYNTTQKFINNNEQDSFFVIQVNENETKRFSPFRNLWELCIVKNGVEYICNNSYSPIPNDCLGQNVSAFVRMNLDDNTIEDIQQLALVEGRLILNFTREHSIEELEFAAMADKCPWLENKLINLDFLLNQNIINKWEYNNIWKIIRDDLRIINGQLLLISASYYEALQTKTKIIAELLNDLDGLGAAFLSDVIIPYSEKGVVSDIKSFAYAYDVFNAKYIGDRQSTIVNYQELMTEYLNKYFQAQQRFLKNIHKFKQFFNAPIGWSGDSKIYKFTLNVEVPTDAEVKYAGIFNNQFSSLTKNFKLYNTDTQECYVPIYDSKRTSIIPLVNQFNYMNFLVLDDNVTMSRCSSRSGYISGKTYYRRTYLLEKPTDFTLKVFTRQGVTFYYWKEDDKYLYFIDRLPAAKSEFHQTEFEFKGSHFVLKYMPLSFNDIVLEFLYKKAYDSEDKTVGWWLHSENILKPTSEWITKTDEFFDSLDTRAWFSLLTSDEHNFEATPQILSEDATTEDYFELYCKNFPITEVTLVNHPQYYCKEYTFTHNDTTYRTSYQRANENGECVSDYIEYWKNCQANVETAEVKNPTTFTKNYTFPLVTVDNEASYCRRTTVAGGESIVAQNVSEFFALILDTLEGNWATTGPWYCQADGSILGSTRVLRQGYYDSKEIIYTTSATAWNTYVDLRKERLENDFIGTIIETNKQPENTAPIVFNEDTGQYIKQRAILASYPEDYPTKWLISTPEGLDRSIGNEYFDKYSLLGLTYSAAQQNSRLSYVDVQLRPLDLNSNVAALNRYYILVQQYHDKQYVFKDIDTAKAFTASRESFSKVRYYPLFKNTHQIDLSQEDLKGKKIKEILEAAGFSELEHDGKWIKGKYDDSICYLLFLQEEDYLCSNLLTQKSFNEAGCLPLELRSSFYKGETLYIGNTKDSVLFSSIGDLTEGLFCIEEKQNNFIAPSFRWDDKKDDQPQYYRFFNGEYQRAYTISQLIALSDRFYYLNPHSYQFESMDSMPTIELPIYLHKRERNLDGILTASCVEHNSRYTFVYNGDNTLVTESITDADGETYELKYSFKREEVSDIQNLTNGTFWYRYHTQTDRPLLFEKAVVIETQLTTYWQQAYNASLYCEYFLPEYWQPRINGQKNSFTNKIFNINDTEQTISISSLILPEVSFSSLNNDNKILKYTWKYGTPNNNQELDDIKRQVNISNIHPATSLKKIKAFSNAFEKVLGEQMNNLYAEETSFYTNYYEGKGGLLWKDVLSTVSSYTKSYENFSGIYVMAYKVLKKCYTNQSFNTYQNLLSRHATKWADLYRDYPGVFLESVYSDSNAASSEELYALATNFFKDKTEPEKNYSISILDSNKIFGYYGQELKIGSNIEINADDFYDRQDYTHKALSQYLFITDISYELRTPVDVKLTVNSIKYQDKLIQRLAKLIK